MPRSQEGNARTPDCIIRRRPRRQATGPHGLEHPGGSGPKAWTGTSGDGVSSPGLDRPRLHREEEKVEAVRPQGVTDHQERTNTHEINQGKQD